MCLFIISLGAVCQEIYNLKDAKTKIKVNTNRGGVEPLKYTEKNLSSKFNLPSNGIHPIQLIRL